MFVNRIKPINSLDGNKLDLESLQYCTYNEELFDIAMKRELIPKHDFIWFNNLNEGCINKLIDNEFGCNTSFLKELIIVTLAFAGLAREIILNEIINPIWEKEVIVMTLIDIINDARKIEKFEDGIANDPDSQFYYTQDEEYKKYKYREHEFYNRNSGDISFDIDCKAYAMLPGLEIAKYDIMLYLLENYSETIIKMHKEGDIIKGLSLKRWIYNKSSIYPFPSTFHLTENIDLYSYPATLWIKKFNELPPLSLMRVYSDNNDFNNYNAHHVKKKTSNLTVISTRIPESRLADFKGGTTRYLSGFMDTSDFECIEYDEEADEIDKS